MYYVYVLFSHRDSKLYTGYTTNLRKRYGEHQAGKSTSTKFRRPLQLIYYEAYLTSGEAERREKYLKGGNGRGQLKRQLSITLEDLEYGFLSTPSRSA
jgi:putative endonuclease